MSTAGSPSRPPPRKLTICTLCKVFLKSRIPYGEYPDSRPNTPEKKYRCAACNDAIYCSGECLETDSDVHSLICPTFNDSPPRPLPDEHELTMVRAIFFEAKTDTPRFVWVGVKDDEPISLDHYLDSRPVEIKFPSLSLTFGMNTVRNRSIPDRVKVYTNGPLNNLEDNNSIKRVIEMSRPWLEYEAVNGQSNIGNQNTSNGVIESLSQELVQCYCMKSKGERPEKVRINGAEMHPWKGNVAFMILREPRKKDDPRTFRDMDATDFRDIVDFLSMCQGHQSGKVGDEESERIKRSKKLEVVQVYRAGLGLEMLGFRQRSVPQDHPMLRDFGTTKSQATLLKISEYIELPILAVSPKDYLRRPRVDEAPATAPTLPWQALLARQFIDPPDDRIELDTDEPIDLWTDGYDNNTHVSVVLFRKDRKSLHSKHVKELVLWIMKVVIPRTGRRPHEDWDDTDHPMFWQDAKYRHFVSRAIFHDYWHAREQKQLEAPHVLYCGQNYRGYTRPMCPYLM